MLIYEDITTTTRIGVRIVSLVTVAPEQPQGRRKPGKLFDVGSSRRANSHTKNLYKHKVINIYG